MKRIKILFLIIAILAGFTACGRTEEVPAETAVSPSSSIVSPSPTAENVEKPVSHYVFQPKVCSPMLEEIMGTRMKDAWFSLVDTVMEGGDTFECPDDETYFWTLGQFPERCFPVLAGLIDVPDDLPDPDHPVKDGVGRIKYTVPYDEVRQQIDSLAALVESILNETLEDDYTDFEKALALYIWSSDYFEYDYESFEKMKDEYIDYLSCRRALIERIGVCQDISMAYSYLLMQVGVDATIMSGLREYDQAGHQWSYVRINGNTYHIDPTYGLNSGHSLEYFMMTDAQREACDSYLESTFVIASNYSQDHPHPDYSAGDDFFEPLWDDFYISFDPGTKKIECRGYDENWDRVKREFDYTGF